MTAQLPDRRKPKLQSRDARLRQRGRPEFRNQSDKRSSWRDICKVERAGSTSSGGSTVGGRECVVCVGTRFINLYTAEDTPAKAA